VSLKQQCLWYESGAYVADFLFGCVSSYFWYRGGHLVVCRARFACWSWERVASWLVGAKSEASKYDAFDQTRLVIYMDVMHGQF